MKTFDKLKTIILEFWEWPSENQINDTARFEDDLGGDSLDLIELLMEVEECFDIEVSDEQAESVKTVGDAVKLIDGLTASA